MQHIGAFRGRAATASARWSARGPFRWFAIRSTSGTSRLLGLTWSAGLPAGVARADRRRFWRWSITRSCGGKKQLLEARLGERYRVFGDGLQMVCRRSSAVMRRTSPGAARSAARHALQRARHADRDRRATPPAVGEGFVQLVANRRQSRDFRSPQIPARDRREGATLRQSSSAVPASAAAAADRCAAPRSRSRDRRPAAHRDDAGGT